MSEVFEMKDFLLNFDIAAITFELKKKVIDKYIDTVYHLNANTIMLRIKPGPIFMIFEAGRRAHITNYKFCSFNFPGNRFKVLNLKSEI